MKSTTNDVIKQNKVFGWIALATVVILAVPLAAMQFTEEVQWTFSDFVIMGALLFGMGSLFVIVARAMPRQYRAPLAIAFFITLLYIWAELAVGILTNIGS